MPMHASLHEDQRRLVLTFDGNLDFGITGQVFAVRQRVSADLASCVMDLTNVERVFDSGLALLQVLCNRCSELGVPVAIKTYRRDLAERLRVTAPPSQQPLRCVGV